MPYANARIVAADDQLINIEALKSHIEALGLVDTCDFCIDGQKTISKVQLILDDAIAARDMNSYILQPLDFLLLDFQMPRKNGIQVIHEVKEYYALK